MGVLLTLIGYPLKLTGKLDLSYVKKSVALANLLIYYSWKNISEDRKNNKIIFAVKGADEKVTIKM